METKNRFAIENGWLLAGKVRVNLAAVECYHCTEQSVVIMLSGTATVVDLWEKMITSTGTPNSKDVQAAVVELMTALDRYYWAGANQTAEGQS